MAEQPETGRGDEPRTDLTPQKEPYYEGYFGDEGDAQDRGHSAGDTAGETAEREEPAPERKASRGGEGEGSL